MLGQTWQNKFSNKSNLLIILKTLVILFLLKMKRIFFNYMTLLTFIKKTKFLKGSLESLILIKRFILLF